MFTISLLVTTQGQGTLNGMTHYVKLMNYDFMMAGVTPLNNDLNTNAKSVWKFFDKLRPQKYELINGPD